jgi:hypothetical protein
MKSAMMDESFFVRLIEDKFRERKLSFYLGYMLLSSLKH